MRTASLRPLTIPPRFVQYAVRNCESTLMQLCRCFTVSPLRSACLTVHQTTTKKSAVAVRMQNNVVVEKGDNESWVRFWLFGPHWSSWSKKWCNVRCFAATYENKIFQHVAFVFSTLAPHLTEQSKVFMRDVSTLHRWKLPYNCASISSLMLLLNPRLKLITKSLIVH